MKIFSKPKVLVCVLTGVERHNWINPYLALNLLTLAQDTRFTVEIEPVIDKHPVDFARNSCVVMARERKADWLFMVDNDQCFEVNPLDALSAGLGKDVIGLPTMQGFNPAELQAGREPIIPNFRTLEQPERDGEFFTVKQIGTGAMFINRRVWEKVRGPWFKTNQSEDEIRTPHAHGEDFYFCEWVQRHGLKVWAHGRVIPHWKNSEVSKVGMRLEILRQMAANGGHAPAKVEWGKKHG